MQLQHLLDTTTLSATEIDELLLDASAFISPGGSIASPSPTLRGVTIVLAFFEPSTRTRLSFETAAQRLGASILHFTPDGSSVNKGESLRETFRTIEAMDVQGIVLRHGQDGVHRELASWTRMRVINAGEGRTSHPTQALLDAATLRERTSTLKGLRVAIVGDVAHSRVARSNVDVLRKCGASVALCAPAELLPKEAWVADLPVYASIDEAMSSADVVCMLRIQRERMDASLTLHMDSYRNSFALTEDRAHRFPNVIVMHPGPVNVGVELDEAVLDLPQTIIHRQVAHGVAVRMAVLNRYLRSPIA